MTARDIARFEKYVYPEPNSGCHIWAGSCFLTGYGKFSLRGVTYYAHRVAWELAGNDPSEIVCHKCDMRWCVNPEHLHGGTQRDNLNDMARRGRGTSGPLPFGVDRRGSAYRARVKYHGRVITVGTFRTIDDAANAAMDMKRVLRP